MTEIISKIEEGKRGTSVTFDSGENLWFSRSLWREAPMMREGQEMDPEELKKWMLVCQYPKALHYAVDLLAQQARSSGEIRKKLKLCRYLDDTVDMVLYKLEKEHLLNDAAYAEQYAASKSRGQTGKNRIRRALREKGVDEETTQAALESIDEEESAEAAAALAAKLLKRYEKEPDPRKRNTKLLMAMSRRGYGFDESKAALEEALRKARETE